MGRFWHPFGQLYESDTNPVVFVRGEGIWVYDDTGRRYLDATAALWYANVGHGRAEIADAIAAQARELAGYSTFGTFSNRPAEELAEFLSARSPMPESEVFFVSGGGDAVETAVKLARRYFSLVGQPERTVLISRTNGYHGTWGFGTSLGGIPANRTGFGELIPTTVQVPWDDVEAVEAAIVANGPERVAAVIAEPVIGAGGVYPPPPGYFEALGATCRRHGVLLIVDSVICGFGRLGTWFGIERLGVEPDLITFAKGVTSGYLPLGGVMVSGRVAAPFKQPGAPVFRHGPTYGGHPTCTAAGIANCRILEDEQILARGAVLEGELLARLRPLASSALVAEVRGGLGLLGAVELRSDLLAEHPDALARLARLALERGIIVRVLATSIALSPPLIIEPAEIGVIVEGLADALDALAAEL
ncbi:aminotransferase class-III [Acidimicrobium ferrooxidans DSM 10331]|uniref:Aminotransferase class-III n=1 Tax=Acidimicrobium ferrooxidans (strain DSM 10331 / JCM 15462 / NBRC 103882 / ICP) TaxID=525909 RepID=C7LZG4_ACIFD|nr:aspartate aminotransferase family protein [Acidimicrobium ferrooxidans]ACU54122.1 aminotransferase class-III [Acidimicrobium ferrooxidans DSM 10331]